MNVLSNVDRGHRLAPAWPILFLHDLPRAHVGRQPPLPLPERPFQGMVVNPPQESDNQTDDASHRAALERRLRKLSPQVQACPRPDCAEDEGGHEADMRTEPPAQRTPHGCPDKAYKPRHPHISCSSS